MWNAILHKFYKNLYNCFYLKSLHKLYNDGCWLKEIYEIYNVCLAFYMQSYFPIFYFQLYKGLINYSIMRYYNIAKFKKRCMVLMLMHICMYIK